MEPDTTHTLIDLPPSSIIVLKRLAIALAVLAALLSFFGRRFGWLDYRPGGAAFDTFISPTFLALLIVATLVALRWEILGSALIAFSAAGLMAFAVEQLVPVHAAVVVAVLALPGIVWLVVAFAELPRRWSAVGAGFAMASTVVGFSVGVTVYDHFWGPTHPSSEFESLPESPIEWVWSGAVTTNSAEVRARPEDEFESVRLAVSGDPSFSTTTFVEPSDASGRVVGFVVEDLDPDTTYHYAVEVDGDLDETRTGALTTFPEGASSYTVAVGACARVGSNGMVFDAIRDLDPLLYLILGDFHYGDTEVNDIGRYREVMDLTLTRPAQAALYRSTPVAYVWDDHDYGPNDSDGNSSSRQAAMAAFREHVPSYPLAGAESAVYQAFTVGRVRFLMTDARSARNLDVDEEFGAASMLGAEQKAWFKSEIVDASRSYELVVWINPVPWVADARDGADHWGGFADERRELADHIADNDIDNLLMVSGDAHMVAIDDGTNTDYSTDGTGDGFPLLHSAALDRPGSTKGGPYSEGSIGGGGQFATIGVVDDGDDIAVTLTALRWDGTELISHEFSTADDPTEKEDE